MFPLLLVLAVSPVEASHQRLGQALKRELERKSMSLAVGGPNELVLRLSGDVFERVDPLWKALGAVFEESRRPGAPTFRVELEPQEHCVQHRDTARHYLFDKRRADVTRVVVWGRCGAEAPDEPSSQQLGALTVEARRFLVGDGAELDGVAFHLSNASDAGVELAVDGLELFSPGDPVQVRAVPITGVWFQAEGQPIVTVREKVLSVPAGAGVQVMLQFEPARADRRTSQRRVRVSLKGERAAVVGPVVRIGFSERSVDGVKP
ncbi:MAG: hypothetical protein Q8L48_00110 [Archangium sp.]|nr:hypothetical protein [Archangium sp.]